MIRPHWYLAEQRHLNELYLQALEALEKFISIPGDLPPRESSPSWPWGVIRAVSPCTGC
jgi:hypothetical protein